jgi:hypothetical protein
LEFNFRDAKQHTGLNHCQARDKSILSPLRKVFDKKGVNIYKKRDMSYKFVISKDVFIGC